MGARRRRGYDTSGPYDLAAIRLEARQDTTDLNHQVTWSDAPEADNVALSGSWSFGLTDMIWGDQVELILRLDMNSCPNPNQDRCGVELGSDFSHVIWIDNLLLRGHRR